MACLSVFLQANALCSKKQKHTLWWSYYPLHTWMPSPWLSSYKAYTCNTVLHVIFIVNLWYIFTRQPHVQRASSGRSSVHTRSSQRTCHEDIQTPGPTPCASTPSQPAPTPSQHDRTPIGSRPVSLDSKKVPPSMPAAEVEDDLETELDTNGK